MATAPFQLWIDLANVATAIRVSSTVTITTASEHGLTDGAYVQVANTTGAAGTSMVGVHQVTVTSGSAFTYTAAGSAGTATVGSAWIANDLLNPPINFAGGTARQGAMVVPLDSLNLSANGDGSGSTMSFSVLQETTPALGPWYLKIPDNARVRLCQKDTGGTPVAADVRFLGIVSSFSAALTGSGQGTFTSVNLGDANYLLDRVAIFGKPGASITVTGGRFTSSGTTATVSFGQVHGFVQGQPIKIGGIPGGGNNGGFTGIRRVNSVAADKKSLTYSVGVGTSSTGLRTVQVSYSRVGSANDRILVTGRFPDLNLLDGDTVTVSPSGGFTTELARILRIQPYSGLRVQRTSANSITLLFHEPYGGTWPTFSGFGSLTATGYVSDVNDGGQLMVTIPSGVTEDAAVTELLTMTNNFHDEDYSLQRTFNTAETANIVGGTVRNSGEALQFPSTSLRSALDTLVETFGGDGKERRYYIDLDGTLNYRLVDAATGQPTYATAPLAIITSGAGNPNTTTTKATIAPYNLSVDWDHETTKNVMMSVPALSGSAYTAVYGYEDITDNDGNQLYATRSGPRFDDVVDYPTGVRNPAGQVQNAAAAYFTERHKPLLSGQFTLRGAGTAAFNQYGFTAGYAYLTLGTVSSASRTGSTVTITTASAHGLTSGAEVVIAGITGGAGTTMNGTFTCTVTSTTQFTYTAAGTAGSGTVTSATAFGAKMVSRWEPGMWCEVVSAGLGLAGLYRVEQVEWTLEPGSYTQVITVRFNRKNPSDLATLIATQTK
jgi:hypothetical protein